MAEAAEPAVVHLYRSGSVEPSSSLPDLCSDTTISALAISRDASLLAVFGSAPTYGVQQYSLSNGQVLVGSKQIRSPGPVSSASYSPGNSERLCASGPSGLYFFLTRKSYKNTETDVVCVAAPASAAPSDISSGPEDASEGAAGILAGAGAAVRQAQESGGHGFGAAAAKAAAGETAGLGGANVWTCHAWLDSERVLAATADGKVHVIRCATPSNSSTGLSTATAPVSTATAGASSAAGSSLAAIQCSVPVSSLSASEGGEVVVLGIAVTSQGALLACSDGALRVVAVPGLQPGAGLADKASAALRLQLLSCQWLGRKAGEGGSLVSLAVMPSQDVAYLAHRPLPPSLSPAGFLRVRLPLPASGEAAVVAVAPALPGPVSCAALLPCLADLAGTPVVSGGSTVARVTSAGGMIGGGAGGGVLVTVDASSGVLSLWSAPPSSGHLQAGSLEACLALASGRRLLGQQVLPGMQAGEAVTCIAAHSRLPLLAVGTSQGRLLTALGQSTSVSTAALVPLYEDRPHAGAVTALSWCTAPGAGQGLLASLCSSEAEGRGVAALHSLGAMLLRHRTEDSEEEQAAGGGHRAIEGAANACTAFAVLAPPSSPVDPILSLAWSSGSLLLGSRAGYVLSLPLGQLPSQPGSIPMDISPEVEEHGQVGKGVLAMAVLHTAAGGSVLLAAVSGGGSGGGQGGGGGVLAAPVGASMRGAPVPNLPAHSPAGAPPVALAICPAAATAESGLVAIGYADGTVAVAHVTGSGQGAGGGLSCHTCLTSTAHAGPVRPGSVGTGGLLWASAGRRVLSVGSRDGRVSVHSIEGSACARAEGGEGLPTGLPIPGTPLGQKEAAVLASLVQVVSTASVPAGEAPSRPPYALLPAPGTVPPAQQGAYPPPPARERAALAAEEAVAAQHAAAKAALLEEVSKFRTQLASLLRENESVSDAERMGRTEYSVDEEGQHAIEAAFQGAVHARRQAYSAEFAALDAAIARVRAACVEKAEFLAREVHAVHADAHVRNFPMAKRSAEQTAALQQFATLRAIELAAMEVEGEGTAQQGGSWAHLLELFPPDADWLVHAGLLAPTLDPAAQLDGLAAAREKAGTAAAGGAARAGAAGADASHPASAAAASGAAGGGSSAPGQQGHGEGTAADRNSGSGGGVAGEEAVAYDGEAVIRLMYHPAAVRTAGQKRAQIAFLRELLRATKARFNGLVDKLAVEKGDLVEGVRARHARIATILTDLGVPHLHTRASDARAWRLGVLTRGLVPAAVLVAAGLEPLTGRPLQPLPPYPQEALEAVAASAALHAASASSSGPALPSNSLAGVVTASGLPLGPSPAVGQGKAAVGPVLVESGPGAGTVMTLTDPVMLPLEDPKKALTVSASGGPAGVVVDPELGVAPYVSLAEKQRKAEEEGKAKAAAGHKDDAPERALVDMFNGRLQGKDELTQMAEALTSMRAAFPFLDPRHKEYVPCLTAEGKPNDACTPEQKSEWDKYNAALAGLEEEKARVRNGLLSELVKLTAESRDLVAAFDERCAALGRQREKTEACAAAVEALCARLALSLEERELLRASDAGLELLFTSRLPLEEEAASAHEAFLAAEAAAGAAVEQAREADRAVERALRAELTEANGGEALDSDLWRVLTTLYKKRWPTPPPPPGPAPPKVTAAVPAAAEGPDGLDSGEEGGGGVVVSDPWSWADTPAQSAEGRAAQLREDATRPLTEADIPDGYGSAILSDRPAVWAALQRQRIAKISCELRVGEAQRQAEEARGHRAYLASVYHSHKEVLDALLAQRDALSAQLETLHADAELLVRMRAGQDEASHLRSDGTAHPLGGDSDNRPVLQDSVLGTYGSPSSRVIV